MKFKNPVTKAVYTNHANYIDSLAETWREVQTEKLPISEKEQLLINALNEAAGHPEQETGTLTVEGTELTVKIVRNLNASYKKERGSEHPIIQLIERYPFLKELYRFEVRECGQRVAKRLAELNNHSKAKKVEKQVFEKIRALRIVKPAKPQISVTEKTG